MSERFNDTMRQIIKDALGEKYDPDLVIEDEHRRDWTNSRVKWLHLLGLDPTKTEHWLLTMDEISELQRQQDSTKWLGHSYANREDIIYAQRMYELKKMLSKATGENLMDE